MALFPDRRRGAAGLVFGFSGETYMEGRNVTGESDFTAVGMTLNFTLWAFIGVERLRFRRRSSKIRRATRADCDRRSRRSFGGRVLPFSVPRQLWDYSQQRTDNFVGAVFEAVSIASLGSTAGKIVAVLCGGGLSGFAGRMDAFGRSDDSGCKLATDCLPTYLQRVSRRRTGGIRVGHRGGDHDAAGFGNDVSTASEQFGKIRLDCHYYDVVSRIFIPVWRSKFSAMKMSGQSGLFYTIVGLIGALYSMAAMIGSGQRKFKSYHHPQSEPG